MTSCPVRTSELSNRSAKAPVVKPLPEGKKQLDQAKGHGKEGKLISNDGMVEGTRD
jgi:hypothetical protein